MHRPTGPRRSHRFRLVAVCAALTLVCGQAATPAGASPTRARPAPDGSHLLTAVPGLGRMLDLTVYSAAMRRAISVEVLAPPNISRHAPVLYLLNGIDGGGSPTGWSGGGNWLTRTDTARFFADKQVTVVMPVGGAGSFFADWRADDPVHGRQRWTTFLTRELPPIIDSAFGGSGANAIAGLSMAGVSVFQLALAAPGLYRGVGSFSGCVRTSDPLGQLMVDTIVTATGGDSLNMWGPPSDPAWRANDPYLHAERLRGLALYIASGNGLPGPLDTLNGPGIGHSPMKLADQLLIGGILDALAGQCTQELRDRLRQLQIPATVALRTDGTHSWGYWQQDLHNAWPTLSAALDR
ncbi:alpha/beta hydrolase [Nocardia macrotermitis]|uniref:Diacylglycerol acyltransferase/mycolyltransferase Ag85B n=1 Tax=Nocardia macrotermitis TaxID=2585198 RepID=A0A7K0CUL1_9NOCA|nr:alpha/beta hydrolase family protein [Nocardia macrotermitis]MQY17166.1 Diacylglycerol acyltransferase/mycolyltransferase Ag85B [Nocardia macrotermitis]